MMMEEKSKDVAAPTLKYKIAYSEKLGRYKHINYTFDLIYYILYLLKTLK